jgi:hypothetical protein
MMDDPFDMLSQTAKSESDGFPLSRDTNQYPGRPLSVSDCGPEGEPHHFNTPLHKTEE